MGVEENQMNIQHTAIRWISPIRRGQNAQTESLYNSCVIKLTRHFPTPPPNRQNKLTDLFEIE